MIVTAMGLGMVEKGQNYNKVLYTCFDYDQTTSSPSQY